MGHKCALTPGTLVLSVIDDSSTCAAEKWPDGKSLPLWGRLVLPGKPPETKVVSVEELKDRSLIDLFNSLNISLREDYGVYGALVEKLMQWRRNRLRDCQPGMAGKA